MRFNWLFKKDDTYNTFVFSKYFIIVSLIKLDFNHSLYISATPPQSVWTMPSMSCRGVWRKTRLVWNYGRIIWLYFPDTLTSRSWGSCVRPPYSWPQATPSGGRYVHNQNPSGFFSQSVYCFLYNTLLLSQWVT